MCLLALACHVHPRYPLIVAANRDEFLERPTEPLHFWPDAPHILAGRDLKGGGTWMGMTTTGNFAALTNHRDLRRQVRAGPSRGLLVRKALEGDVPEDTSMYEGFNLIHGHWQHLHYRNNINGASHALQPGIHGLSNGVLNTPWPKVLRAKQEMERIAGGAEPRIDDLFRLLANDVQAEVKDLPDTGIGAEWEMILSAIRIRTTGYGTRCSTVILVDAHGHATIEERTWDAEAPVVRRHELDLPSGNPAGSPGTG
jgi:uncharacterized protein with NRDE domain